MPVHARRISTAAVGLALCAAPVGSLDASATGSGRTSGSAHAAGSPELAYQRIPPGTPGTGAPRSAEGWRALYLGDSMSFDTTDELRAALPEWRIFSRNFGGTAPCDWADPAVLADFLDRARPDFVVFSFIGNSITPCTHHEIGAALLNAYRRDLVRICRAAAPARCVAVGQPTLGPKVCRTLPGPDEPTSMYRHQAFLGQWGFVDAGAATETPGGGFDQAMRDPDGVHFSQPGAGAFANAIAAYLEWLTSPRGPTP